MLELGLPTKYSKKAELVFWGWDGVAMGEPPPAQGLLGWSRPSGMQPPAAGRCIQAGGKGCDGGEALMIGGICIPIHLLPSPASPEDPRAN